MSILYRAMLVALITLIAGLTPIVVPITAVGAAEQILAADPGSGSIRGYSADVASPGVLLSGLNGPSWITVDRTTGNIYVSEFVGRSVSRFSPTGAALPLLQPISTPYDPGGVQVGADGTIFVADYDGGNVYFYSASGAYLGVFPSGGLRADFMAFDAAGNLYVTDSILGDVRQFPANGTAPPNGTDPRVVVSGFSGLAGIAFDANGDLYVASFTNRVIAKYSPDGVAKGTFASLDPITYPTASIMGMAFDAAGNLYVANMADANIHKFSSTGDDLGIFASTGLAAPRDVAIGLAAAPAVKEECRQDGWQSFDAFDNQGDCIQFLNTGK